VLKYTNGEVDWILATGLGPKRAQLVRAAKDPAYRVPVEPDNPAIKDPEKLERDRKEKKERSEKETAKYRTLAADAYEVSGPGVAFLRFRCAAPLDKADVRRALAATLCARPRRRPAARPARRDPLRARARDRSARLGEGAGLRASKAKGWYGSKSSRGPGLPADRLPSDETAVADLMAKQWKVLPDDASTWAGQEDDLRKRLDSGNWNAAIEIWKPKFDDPLAFLGAFTSGNPVSGTNWSNATYDALIKAAYDVGGYVTTPDPALKDVASIQSLFAAAKPGDAASLEALRRGLAEAEAILSRRRSCPLWTTSTRAWSRRTCAASFQGPRRGTSST
jgi:hypothetical protein